MRSLRQLLPVLTLVGLMPSLSGSARSGRCEGHAIAGCAAQARARASRRRVRHAGRRGGDKRVQGRDGLERREPEHRIRLARSAREDAAPVCRLPGKRPDRPVELLPGRIRSLPRGRLERRHNLDECRWLNSGGSRIAQVRRGKIKAWKQISAEEASKVLVQALVAGDLALLETVMASPEELTAAGVPKDVVAKIAAAAEKRAEQLAALQKQLIGWNTQTIWNRFDGTFPHVIPADPASRAGEGRDALRKRHGDPGNDGRSAECGQAGVSCRSPT